MESRRKKSMSNLLPRRQSINDIFSRRKSITQNLRRRRRKSSINEDDGPPPILDSRIEEIISILKLKRKDLLKCWNVFRLNDLNNKGYYSLDSILTDIVSNEPRTLFVETIFELSDVIDLNRIEYGPLFYTIASFCMFELEEMVKVIFFMFDKDKNGDINKEDMMTFLKILHNQNVLKKNIQTSLESFEVKRDGTIEFLPVVRWCRRFPSVLEPGFRLQGK